MKKLSFIIAAIAVPASAVFAQTPPPATTATENESSIPYIPLIGTAGSTGSTNTGSNAMTWFIDVANRQVVACSQPVTASTAGGAAQNFSCTAQPIPTAASTAQ